MKRTFTTTIGRAGAMCFLPLTFDPVPVFGQAHAPVVVTVAGHTFRSTIATKAGHGRCIPLRRSHREAAGLAGDETVRVTLALDTEPRVVTAPRDLVAALKASGAAAAWRALSYSHQREHVEAIEQAAKPETRARRIAAAVAMVTAKAR